MSRSLAGIAAGAVLLVAAGARPARAMTDNVLVKAHLPFAFQVGEQQMPAGNYVISSLGITEPSLIEVRRTGAAGPAAIFLTVPEGSGTVRHARMVFDTVGKRKYLRAILIPGQPGAQFPVARAEIEAASAAARKATHTASMN
jgi:hypothetical protein